MNGATFRALLVGAFAAATGAMIAPRAVSAKVIDLARVPTAVVARLLARDSRPRIFGATLQPRSYPSTGRRAPIPANPPRQARRAEARRTAWDKLKADRAAGVGPRMDRASRRHALDALTRGVAR